MPSSSDVRLLVAANRKIQSLALREFSPVWASLDTGDALAVKRVLLEVMPDLVAKYGDLTATVAADLYEQWRADAGVRGLYVPLTADPPPAKQVQASVRFAISSLFQATPDAAAVHELLTGDVLSRYLANQSRATIEQSARRDPAEPRWARIPVGKTCEYCVMLGSRGAAYHGEDTALAASHGNCDCAVLPEFEPGDLPEDYHPDALYEQWQSMTKTSPE